MKQAFLLSILLLCLRSFAQEPCNEDAIMLVKGKWSKKPDNGISGSHQSQLNSRISKFQKLLQDAYPQPVGTEAKWKGYMGGHYASNNKNSLAYEMNAMFYNWYCNTTYKKMMLSIEYGTTFDIWVNKLKWFATENEGFLINGKPIYMLTERMGEMNGFPVFAGNENSAANTGTSYSRTILISRQGELPYIPVTRKEYLTVYLQKKESSYQSSLEYPRKSLANNPNRLQDELARLESIYRRDIKPAKDFLENASEAELNAPAYIENTSYSYSFLGFAKESKGRLLAQLNNNYFNNKLPAYVPQFIVVYWRWSTEKPSLDFASHIEKNFDFKALQAMIDR